MNCVTDRNVKCCMHLMRSRSERWRKITDTLRKLHDGREDTRAEGWWVMYCLISARCIHGGDVSASGVCIHLHQLTNSCCYATWLSQSADQLIPSTHLGITADCYRFRVELERILRGLHQPTDIIGISSRTNTVGLPLNLAVSVKTYL